MTDMKKILLYLCTLTLLVGAFWSCDKDEINSESIFVDPTTPRTAFDEWLLMNYTYPYNIDFKYKMEDMESDLDYQLAPAKVENSMAMAKLILYLWVEAYNEHVGIDFMRTYIPRVIHLIGSGAYNTNNTVVLGTAEGGMKITLYDINGLDIDNVTIDQLNSWYLRTMHHEFAHILHQTKNYPVEFRLITKDAYLGDDWNTPISGTTIEAEALRVGFISAYSRKNYDEDFVELIAHYLINTAASWNTKLTSAGTDGRALIEQKFTIIRAYLKDSWSIDVDELRNVVQERSNTFKKLDLRNL
jgi:substrate import-associated zinc metallohydrolase lipoprotein